MKKETKKKVWLIGLAVSIVGTIIGFVGTFNNTFETPECVWDCKGIESYIDSIDNMLPLLKKVGEYHPTKATETARALSAELTELVEIYQGLPEYDTHSQNKKIWKIKQNIFLPITIICLFLIGISSIGFIIRFSGIKFTIKGRPADD